MRTATFTPSTTNIDTGGWKIHVAKTVGEGVSAKKNVLQESMILKWDYTCLPDRDIESYEWTKISGTSMDPLKANLAR